MFPALFLSHGSPMMALTDSPARDFLRGLGREVGRPRAILVASAHWETPMPTLNSMERNATIHDFYGFPAALFAMRYEPPGAPDVAEKAAALLTEAGLPAAIDEARGLDHGAWVPLTLMYPAADIPVLQVSIQPDRDPAHHLRLGRALAPLRDDNVLIIGSGSFTHNLRLLRRDVVDGAQPPDVVAFADWFDTAISEGRIEDLLAYRTRAPYAERQHPTDEHLLPLYVALGPVGRRRWQSGCIHRRCIPRCGWMLIRSSNGLVRRASIRGATIDIGPRLRSSQPHLGRGNPGFLK
jgi:4,5-DOPA dioxygenase extradiol